MGVAAPLKSYPRQDLDQATYLGGSGKAAVVLAVPPTQDAAMYTPAAALTTDVNDVEGGHYMPTIEAEVGETSVAALSAQGNWASGRLNPFGNLWDVLAPVRDWFASLMPVPTLQSAWVLSGAEASALSMPVSLQNALTDPTLGKPVETVSKPGKKPGQGTGSAKVKAQKSLPAWLRYYRPSPTR